MREVNELYGSHQGADIYIVGTGTSLRVFPPAFFAGRITIGLNLAWRTVPVTYGITIHPDLNVPEFIDGETPRPEITWIVKGDKLKGMAEDHVRYGRDRFYNFRTDGKADTSTSITGRSDQGRVPQWLREPTGNFLYLWTSIAQPAVNLAANMGARNIILVGCDNAALGGNHHSSQQHTMWQGASPEQRYREYYEGLAEARSVLRERGINVVSMNPFLTLGPHAEDFERLCVELEQPTLLEGGDITASYTSPSKAAGAAPVSRAERLARSLPAGLRGVVPRAFKHKGLLFIRRVRRARR